MRPIADEQEARGALYIEGPPMPIEHGRIWAFIERSLDAMPGAVSIKCGERTLTRRDLHDAITNCKLPAGARRVGICVSRSLAGLVATLAAWRNGATYVPLPVEYPPARIRETLRSCDVDLIVTDTPMVAEGYEPCGGDASLDRPLTFLRRNGPDCGEFAGEATCYIAHTSGTTGSPKSVRVGHRSVVNRLTAMTRILGAGADDTFLYKTSSSFDVHVWEFTLPLFVGGTMVISPQTPYFDLISVGRLISTERVTFVGFVPSLLRQLLELPEVVGHNDLRVVLCGGEAWTPQLAEKFHSRLPGRQLFNSYGPAETTIAVANWPVPPGTPEVCIGTPMPNSSFLIEPSEQPSPEDGDSVTGTLSIGGAQVALGYVQQEHQHAFFTRVIEGNPVRFYRTGDLVRLDRATGLVKFAGRADSQVKINGVRIELEEIEKVIARVDGVEACFAGVVRSGTITLLCAAFKTVANIPLDVETIRAACRHRLPAAMVPARFRQVTSFPLKASGKIDRLALFAVDSQSRSPTTAGSSSPPN